MEIQTPRPSMGAWLKVIFYTFHQALRILSGLFAIVPLFGRFYIIRIALTYLAAFLTLCTMTISLLAAFLRIL
ncbi:hypothetical protein [Rothia amarae]|uniref:hypothetical protein n=1 Tax=Rothia amarae TaxID=169480 RepID=UPI0033CBAA44